MSGYQEVLERYNGIQEDKISITLQAMWRKNGIQRQGGEVCA
jgi:hypothetical protein